MQISWNEGQHLYSKGESNSKIENLLTILNNFFLKNN